MRWVFLILLLVSLPILASYASKGAKERDQLIILLGVLLFATGEISFDAAVISWPAWPGTSKGLVFSFVDCIAIALLVTRIGRFQMPPFLGFAALFMIPMISGFFLAAAKMPSFFFLAQFVQSLILYLALSHELKRDTAIRSLLKGIAFGLIIQAGYVIQQKLTGVVQASGTVVHQNILGLMVQFAAFPLIAAVMEGERSKVVYAGAIAGAICVVGGGSRGTMAFFAAGLCGLLIISLVRRSTARKWKILSCVLGASLLFVPLALGTLRDRFGETEMGTTDQSRVAFERAARAMAADHPFGVGPNNFVTVNNMQGYAAEAGIAWGGGLLDKPVHNAFLLARSEMGWAGELAFILLLGAVATQAYITGLKARAKNIVGLSLGCAVGITATSIHSFLEYAWFTLEPQRLFFVNAALIAGCTAIAADAEKIRRRLRKHKESILEDNQVFSAGKQQQG